ANPAGFATPTALLLGSVKVQLDTSSVTGSGPIVIKQIDVEHPEVTYEAGRGGSNLQTIQKNAMAYAQSMMGATPPPAPGAPPPRKLQIDDLYVRSGKVNVSATILQGQALGVDLPTIHLANIGRGGGATPAEVAAQVLGSISSQSVRAATTALAGYA